MVRLQDFNQSVGFSPARKAIGMDSVLRLWFFLFMVLLSRDYGFLREWLFGRARLWCCLGLCGPWIPHRIFGPRVLVAVISSSILHLGYLYSFPRSSSCPGPAAKGQGFAGGGRGRNCADSFLPLILFSIGKPLFVLWLSDIFCFFSSIAWDFRNDGSSPSDAEDEHF